MSSASGYIYLRNTAIALTFLLILPQEAACQKSILDSAFTFIYGRVKTGNALDIITSNTGYNFTYDSRLVDPDIETDLTFQNTKLQVILDNILKNDSLLYSVIDKFIIISLAQNQSPTLSDSTARGEINYITGIIVDDDTQEPLPFATIGLKNTGKGTVSNNNGEFGLKFTSDMTSDTLSISYLGYFRKDIPLNQASGNKLIIGMRNEFISIPEIIIRNQIPQEIISKARLAIPQNYGNTPAYLTGFYREGVIKKLELQSYSEAILHIFKSAYSGTLQQDQIKVYKSRKIENIDRSDTLAVRLKAGLRTCIELDGAKNIFDFLSYESLLDYTYRLTDIVTYDDEAAYAIEFEQREHVETPLYKGIIYINTADYAILNAEFELNQQLIHKMKESFISHSSRRFNTWPVSVKYSVSYRQLNDRYFLSHVRGDLIFTSKQKKKLFNTQFKVFFELAITLIDLKDVSRFEKDELAPIHSIFSKTITSYDSQFWGDQDFLRPEENLLQALKNMNVKMQEFTK